MPEPPVDVPELDPVLLDEPDPVLDVVPDSRIGGAALPPAEMLAVLPGEDSTAPTVPVEPSKSAVST